MKTHRFMALLCAGIMALNSAGGQVIHSYAAEAREIVQEQSESAAFSETEASDFIVEASDPAAGEETGVADPEADRGAEEARGTDDAETGRDDQTSAEQDEAGSDEGTTQEFAAASDEGTETGDAAAEAAEGNSTADDAADGDSTANDATEGGSSSEAQTAGRTNAEAQTAGGANEEANGNSELIEEEAGISDLNEKVASLLPLEEKTAALILPGLTETELKKVKVSRIVDYLQDKDGNYYNFTRTDRFIWSYYKDEYGEIIRDEYHEVTRSDTVDMSVFKDVSAGFKMELIVGDGSQLGSNTRYIVSVYLTNSISEFNSIELYTQDRQGERREVKAERLRYVNSGSEFYVPGHQKGTEYFVAFRSEIINHPDFNVEVYTQEEYEKRLSDGWQSATPITDRILNPNMLLKDRGYKTTLDEEDDRVFVLVVESPETHAIYDARERRVVVKGSSIYIDSSLWTEKSGVMVKAASMTEDPVDWYMYSIKEFNGVEQQNLMLLDDMWENEDFYLALTAHHDIYGNEAVRHITGSYEGAYETAAEAAKAGAADLTGKLFADIHSAASSGYRLKKEELFTGRVFSVFFDDGTACKIQISISGFTDSHYTIWENYYSEPVIGEQDPWFRVTGVKKGNRELDSYVVENGKSKTLDTYYGIGYQTLFVNEYLSAQDLKALKPIFWVADSSRVRIRTNANAGAEEVSGVTEHDFTNPNEYYALFEERQKNYVVEIVPKSRGAKLYVFGADGTKYERNREIFLDDYHEYKHDILIANVGDQKLEGLSVRLENASNVKIDDYWTVGGEGNDTLEPFTSADKTEQYGELQNLAKVRVVSDGIGEITGDLVISAKGQESVVIHLSGSAIQPVIRTKELTYAVKYVPYSYIISTSNMNEKVDVTYELKGKLPAGMMFDAKTGELYGVPREAGEYSFTVTAHYSEESFSSSSRRLKLTVKDNEDETVFNATDEGYEIIPEENGMSGYVGEQVSEYKFVLDPSAEKETFITGGDFVEFEKLWLNGVELEKGTDYIAEPGSTISTLFLKILRKKALLKNGRNTISAQYRIKDSGGSGGSSGGDSSGGGSSGGSSSGGSSSGGSYGGGSGGGRSYDSWSSNGGGGGGSTIRRSAQNFMVNLDPIDVKVKYMEISKTTAKIHKGNVLTLKATCNYDTKIVWSSSKPAVARVNSEGRVRAVAKGDCVITAKASDGRKVMCAVHVMIPVKTLNISKTSLTLRSGRSTTLTTTVTPSSVDKKDLVWSSSNTKVAKVSSSGKITGVGKGTCTITVKAPNGRKKTCRVTVVNIIDVKRVTMNITRKTMFKGEAVKLIATVAPSNASNKTLKWASNHPEVATVTNGRVVAVGKGRTKITATSNNGKTASCIITVELVPVSSISLKLDRLILKEGDTQKLAVELLPSNASDRSTVWTSSDESVATVSGGRVTGKATGKTVITVRSSNGLESSCEVTVVDPGAEIPEIRLSRSSLEIEEGKTATLSAELITEGAMDETILWESLRPEVAQIANGRITAKKAGYTTILVRSVYNTVATCSVRVKAPVVAVTKITLDKSSLVLNPGYNETSTAVLKATVLPVNATDRSVIWKSEDESIAVVKEGVVGAVKAGKTKITATASNGMKAECEVTVEQGPRRVSTAQDLINMAQDLRADYILANDIDLSGMAWTPIGTGADRFYGTFDGNGHSITGMNVTGGQYCGLFTIVRGTVKNLTVSGTIRVNADLHWIDAGGICGILSQGTIDNCRSNVEIICSNRYSEDCTVTCGGITGSSNRGVINNCVNNGNVSGTITNAHSNVVNVGGIAGDSINNNCVWNCINTGTVRGNAVLDDSKPYVRVACGGIVGEVNIGTNFKACSNSGSVSAFSSQDKLTSERSYNAAGGIVGIFDSGTIEDCTSSSALEVGGNASTVRMFKGEIAGCKEVTVLTLNERSKTVNLGDSFTLTYRITPSDASTEEVIWSSTDESIATVTNGTVKTVGVGKARIRAASRIGGEYDECSVTVQNPDSTAVSEIKVSSGGSNYVGVGQKIQYTATVLPDTALDKTCVWSSSDTSVATVDQSGLVTTHKAGDAVITAASANGIKGSVTLHVEKAQVEIGDPKSFSVLRGEKFNIPIRLYLDGQIRAGGKKYILYSAYYSAGTGWIELASFDIDGDQMFKPRYIGRASVISYTVNGNIVDLILEVDTSKVELLSEHILAISVFPYDNFATGGSLDDDAGMISVRSQ